MKLVLLPGLDGTGSFTGPIEQTFGTRYDVISVKFPQDMSDYSELEAYSRKLMPKDDFVILAESFSGPLAAMIARNPPTGLKGVIFAVTFAHKPRPYPVWSTHLIKLLPFHKGWFSRPLLWGSLRYRPVRVLEDLFVEAVARVPAKTFAMRSRQSLLVDVRELLTELPVPAICVKARHEYVVRRSAWKDFQAAGIPVIEINGSHLLMYEMAEEAEAALRPFLEGLT